MDIDKIISQLTLEEKAGLCSGADYWHTKAIDRFGIPRIMMCDATHGLRKQIGEGDHLGINESIPAVCFPTASAMASSFDRNLLARLGETMAGECQAENIGMLLGPGVNIKRNPLCGRNFEYFSEDPYLAGELAAAYVESIQKNGIASCVKHFAANNQESCRMSGNSRVDERTLHEIYLPAFEAVVKKGNVRSVMCAYNQLNGVFCSENKTLLTDILRDEWGFDGFVVTDWGAIKDRVKGLEAGLDLEMPGGPGMQDKKIIKAIQNGTLPESVLDNAVRKILHFISDSQANHKESYAHKGLDIEKDRMLSLEFAKECAVLLKNDGNLLPLDKSLKIVFIGEFAGKPRYQGGGSSHVNVAKITNALDAVEGMPITYTQGYSLKEDDEDETLLQEAVAAARAADVVVLFIGLPDFYETEGADRTHMKLPENQEKLIKAVTAVQSKTVAVMHGGSAVTMPWANQVPAILYMYLSGDNVGAAVAALLFGEANPSGKLAETFPFRLEDNPSFLNFPGDRGVVEYREGIYVGYRYYDKRETPVLFPFGHGLSYTSFEYNNLVVNKTSLTDEETVTVCCSVKNTGTRFGKEVIQLYVRDKQSTVSRPIRELKGFTKIALNPGEEKSVSFLLDKRSFAYYEEKIHDWYVESGEFILEIGASSRDIRLTEKVYVQSTRKLPIFYTRFSTVSEVLKNEKGAETVRQLLSKTAYGKNETSDLPERNDDLYMGEGSTKRIYEMIQEMPLSSFITFGQITEEQMDDFLQGLNSD
jgi:beta-glucosidase